jgi:hypothetical protein
VEVSVEGGAGAVVKSFPDVTSVKGVKHRVKNAYQYDPSIYLSCQRPPAREVLLSRRSSVSSRRNRCPGNLSEQETRQLKMSCYQI